jgi:hypothetical protein
MEQKEQEISQHLLAQIESEDWGQPKDGSKYVNYSATWEQFNLHEIAQGHWVISHPEFDEVTLTGHGSISSNLDGVNDMKGVADLAASVILDMLQEAQEAQYEEE